MVEARLARQILGRRHVAGGRQPAELDREQEDQHDAEPEIRRRDAPQREQVGAVVPGGAFLHRGDDAGGNADQERDHDRHRGELQRHRQLLRDQVAHRHLDAQRLAEVAGQHALDPVDVLHRDRLIEPVLLADLLDHGGIALLAGHDQRGIAGQQIAAARRSGSTRRTVSGSAGRCGARGSSAWWRSRPGCIRSALAVQRQSRDPDVDADDADVGPGSSIAPPGALQGSRDSESVDRSRPHFSFSPTTRTSPSGICL